MTAEEILASKTETELRNGLDRANRQMLAIDALEQTEDFFPNGPFPLSKQYEKACARVDMEHRRLLNSAINQTVAELVRRGIQP